MSRKEFFINILLGLWYILMLFVSIAYCDIRYEKMYDYHDVLHQIIGVCGGIFLFILPLLIKITFDIRTLEEKTKDYDDIKRRYEDYEKLLLEHNIIRYVDD